MHGCTGPVLGARCGWADPTLSPPPLASCFLPVRFVAGALVTDDLNAQTGLDASNRVRQTHIHIPYGHPAPTEPKRWCIKPAAKADAETGAASGAATH
jgi:hypothetical protein